MWSLNRLMDMIGTLATRVVTAETRAAGQQRWQGWEQICGALHLEEEQLLVALGPQAKALLLWMQGGVVGRQPVAFQVPFPPLALLLGRHRMCSSPSFGQG